MKAILTLLILTLPVAAQWAANPEQANARAGYENAGGVAIDFQKNDFTGYFVTPHTTPLAGAVTVTFLVTAVRANPLKRVRFIPREGPCVQSARVYLYFQTGALYNPDDGTRWWSAQAVELNEDTGLQAVTVPLNPALWTSTYGHGGAALPAAFANALAHPTYVGVTFGGNCANGHGILRRKGFASFTVLEYVIQ